MLIEVALPLAIYKTFVYAVPQDLISDVKIGIAVYVPFGSRELTGYVVGYAKSAPEGIKNIKGIVSSEPLFSKGLLNLFNWLSNYYLVSLGTLIKASIPSRLFVTEKIMVYANTSADIRKIKENIVAIELYNELVKRSVSRNYIRKKFKNIDSTYRILLKTGLIYEKKEKRVSLSSMRKNGVKLCSDFQEETFLRLQKLAPKQAEVYRLLSLYSNGLMKSEIYEKIGNVYSQIKALVEKGFIEYFEIPYTQKIPIPSGKKKKKPRLTRFQKNAVDVIKRAIYDKRFETFLLFGITGSGKTEVYLRVIEEVLKKGKSAIVLVPEISLTAQTLEIFRARFGETVVIYHSRLNEVERLNVWRGIKNGDFKVVIGARFAVFAPVKNLGVIIVDEEHESTYKQKSKEPFYSARDVAVVRTKIEKAVCVLGSATPSVESFYNAQKGKYKLIILPERIDERKLPPVQIVDMKKEKDNIISQLLHKKIKDRIEKAEQIILFINRRGFSNYVICRDCGYSPRCPFCDLTLTYHRREKVLKCHYCGYEEEAPRVCPKCGSPRFFYAGMGTQRIEQYLEKQFQGLRIMRVDLDTMRSKWAHIESFFQFRDGKADLLLGTQMIAKGFDLPKVTLVGVVSGDTVLNFPDFRAQERTFQLLTQVAGRTGRGILGGEVIIQTYNPDHYVIRYSQHHNYEMFYSREIETRKELNYPPYSKLTRIIFSSEEETLSLSAADKFTITLRKQIKTEGLKLEVLGPAPCPLKRLKGRYRFHILIKSKKPFIIQKVLLPIKIKYRVKGVHILYDIDPIDMM